MILEIFKMWSHIRVEDCLTFPVNLRWFTVFSCFAQPRQKIAAWHMESIWIIGKRFWKSVFNVCFNQRLFSQNSIRRRAKRTDEAAPEADRTKSSHTSEDGQNQGTIPMPTFARRPLTASFTTPVELPQNYMVGQQRPQISELQFDKFPNPTLVLGVENSIQNPSRYLVLIFHRMPCCGSKKWRWLFLWTS